MFRRRRTIVESDEGFSIKVTRSLLEYRDARYHLKLNHELEPAPNSLALWVGSVFDLNPGLNMSSTEAELVVARVVAALEFIGYTVHLV